MARYIVWIDIEEADYESDKYRMLDCLNIPPCASFDTEEEANAFAKELYELSQTLWNAKGK